MLGIAIAILRGKSIIQYGARLDHHQNASRCVFVVNSLKSLDIRGTAAPIAMVGRSLLTVAQQHTEHETLLLQFQGEVQRDKQVASHNLVHRNARREPECVHQLVETCGIVRKWRRTHKGLRERGVEIH